MNAVDKRRAVWKHNALLGHARMMQVQALDIVNSLTTTPMAKAYANDIYHYALRLAEELKTRVDP